MKKKWKFLMGMLVCLFVLTVSGCTTTEGSITGRNSGQFPSVSVAAKDFTPVGMVFTETVLVHDRNRARVSAAGEILTYHALLRQAQAQGAHAIINVTIDVKTETTGTLTTFGIFTFADNRTVTETWMGSALAIRYAGSLGVNQPVSGNFTPAVAPIDASDMLGEGEHYGFFGRLFRRGN